MEHFTLPGSGAGYWDSSYADADSITDLGLFEMVGNPIAVYPDANLLAHAEINDWEMIGSG